MLQPGTALLRFTTSDGFPGDLTRKSATNSIRSDNTTISFELKASY